MAGWRAWISSYSSSGDAEERGDADAGDDSRGVAHENLEPALQRHRQRVGERRQQHARVGLLVGQARRAMQGNDGLAGAGRAGDAHGAVEVALHQLPLGGVEEDDPLLPGEAQRLLQLGNVLHHAEATLCIGMQEGIGDRHGCGHVENAGRDELQQRLAGLGRQVGRDVQEAVLGGGENVVDPVGRHADGHELAGIERPEREHRLAPHRLQREQIHAVAEIELQRDRPRRRHLLDALAHLDDLDGAGLGMRLDAAALGPLVGVVVVADVGQQEALRRLVDDDPDIPVDPARPEIRVLGGIDAMQLQPRMLRIDLKVDNGDLDSLLLIARQLAQGRLKAVGQKKLHG